ncbi:hypothetical protein CEXT_315431 [Caerostris extrusa]|uniref:Uncharacterized protein n=1 Tax=Caerostris extrusa TaxID=172846 RepID=A0AAV4QEL2_CAEEX|nr:hypothetical protein CEXT_315431 [Caerostris extrusa]
MVFVAPGHRVQVYKARVKVISGNQSVWRRKIAIFKKSYLMINHIFFSFYIFVKRTPANNHDFRSDPVRNKKQNKQGEFIPRLSRQSMFNGDSIVITQRIIDEDDSGDIRATQTIITSSVSTIPLS